MTTTKTTDNHSLQNALGHLESIRDLMRRIETALADDDYNKADSLRGEGTDMALSVEMRSDWTTAIGKDVEMVEYRILLSTGGPACQITGDLGQHGEPETATLEHQDWGTPWMPVTCGEALDGQLDGPATPDDWEAVQSDLLAFARLFYFGE